MVGRSSASLASSIISPTSRDRKLAPSTRLSAPAATDSSPPAPSIASANCAASRVPAPFCSRSASSAAVPSRPGGSASAPPRTTTFSATSGVSRFGISATCAPLASVTRSKSGSFTPAGAAVAAARHSRAQDRQRCGGGDQPTAQRVHCAPPIVPAAESCGGDSSTPTVRFSLRSTCAAACFTSSAVMPSYTAGASNSLR